MENYKSLVTMQSSPVLMHSQLQPAELGTHKSVMINAHWADGEAKTAVELAWMKASQKGQGRIEYEAWEKSLPPTVKVITLFAADSDGSGNSDAFWEKMGFDWVWSPGDDSDIDYESMHRMHKGINGHPTPASKHWVNAAEESLADDSAPTQGQSHG